jgi:hypothetical protein
MLAANQQRFGNGLNAFVGENPALCLAWHRAGSTQILRELDGPASIGVAAVSDVRPGCAM